MQTTAFLPTAARSKQGLIPAGSQCRVRHGAGRAACLDAPCSCVTVALGHLRERKGESQAVRQKQIPRTQQAQPPASKTPEPGLETSRLCFPWGPNHPGFRSEQAGHQQDQVGSNELSSPALFVSGEEPRVAAPLPSVSFHALGFTHTPSRRRMHSYLLVFAHNFLLWGPQVCGARQDSGAPGSLRSAYGDAFHPLPAEREAAINSSRELHSPFYPTLVKAFGGWHRVRGIQSHPAQLC